MKLRSAFLTAALGTSVLTVAIVTGCSGKSSSPSNPVGGGGGGGGATFSSSLLQRNDTFSFTFSDTGVTNYHCGVHPTAMSGNSVTVTSTAPVTGDPVSVSIVGLNGQGGFVPRHLEIQPGITVVWKNDDATNLAHSVVND